MENVMGWVGSVGVCPWGGAKGGGGGGADCQIAKTQGTGRQCYHGGRGDIRRGTNSPAGVWGGCLVEKSLNTRNSDDETGTSFDPHAVRPRFCWRQQGVAGGGGGGL
eukprot:189916-Hanusia_phi.AAC.2